MNKSAEPNEADYQEYLAVADSIISTMMLNAGSDLALLTDMPKAIFLALLGSELGDARTDLLHAEEKYKETKSFHWDRRKREISYLISSIEKIQKRIFSGYRLSEIRHRVASQLYETFEDEKNGNSPMD